MPILPRTERRWLVLSLTSLPSTRRSPSSSPSTSIVPASGFSSIMTRRSRVVLPEPLGPMTAMRRPASTSRSISRRMWAALP